MGETGKEVTHAQTPVNERWAVMARMGGGGVKKQPIDKGKKRRWKLFDGLRFDRPPDYRKKGEKREEEINK